MRRRTMLAGSALLAAGPLGLARPAAAQTRTRIVWWHAMTATNAEQVARIVQQFNAAQNEVEVQAVYKGTYPETLTAAIAAFRAGQAPHLVQIFEVGTGSMLVAGRAVKQVWQLSQDTGVPIDPAQFIPAVRGYYSLADGRLASMPFNSSTAVMWYNKDAFAKAGLDPELPPATWQETVVACRALKDKNAIEIPMMTGWPSWIQFEQVQRDPQSALCERGERLQGAERGAEVQQPGSREALAAADGHGPRGHVPLRRSGRRAGKPVPGRHRRDHVRVVRRPRALFPRQQIPLG